MIGLVRAILRAFLADRVAAVLTLLAPVAFFTLLATFYRHMESADGFKLGIAIVDGARTEDSRAFVQAISGRSGTHFTVYEVDRRRDVPANAVAVVEVAAGFSRATPMVSLGSQAPLPGVAEAVVQMVELATIRALVDGAPLADVRVEARAGMLLRGSAAGIALIFVMFSAASIAGRGLGDDATGLVERMRSLAVSTTTLVLARLAAMTVIAWAQMATTLAWAAVVFGVVPQSIPALVVAAGLGSAACTAFVCIVASAVGNRTRFAAVAPVVILVASALSGSMIPRVLLPATVAEAGSWSFPSWAIDACTAAIDGWWDWQHLGTLAAFIVACTGGAILLKRRSQR